MSTDMRIEDYARIAAMQDELANKAKKEQEDIAKYLARYEFCEPFKNNTALTRKEKKEVLKALKKYNDGEAKDLFSGDQLKEILKTKATLHDLTEEQKEVVFETLSKLRGIEEPVDVTVAEIYNFVDIVIGRTYNPKIFEGK